MVKSIIAMSNLEAIKVSFPVELYIDVEPEIIAEEKAKFSTLISRVLAEHCAKNQCHNIKWIHSQ